MIKGNSLKTEFKRRVRKNTQELVVAEAKKQHLEKLPQEGLPLKVVVKFQNQEIF